MPELVFTLVAPFGHATSKKHFQLITQLLYDDMRWVTRMFISDRQNYFYDCLLISNNFFIWIDNKCNILRNQYKRFRILEMSLFINIFYIVLQNLRWIDQCVLSQKNKSDYEHGWRE